MKNSILLRAIPLVALACSLCCAAQDKGYWPAASSTAGSITGDISLSNAKITINYTTFRIVQARTLTPNEVSASFDADINAGRTGVLYSVTVPAATRFLHHNTLCGTEDTRWMATFVSGRTLQVAFFSGSDVPVFTMDALAKSTDLCGTFTYAR
ncbi:MAG: hypothetical protein WA634_02735 [Silvibacterium sp.]